MYTLALLEHADTESFDEGPTRRAIDADVESAQMRPSVWEYETGEKNVYHRQEQQEELYVVLEGHFDVTIERDDEREVLEIRPGAFLLVPPSSWRQFEALEPSRLLVVGAPNVADDGILER
ncbi:cupin domain-containing protein [Natronobiforma cellulositropha]|uniref:cupin domain-containing protein n=1 Tax=Natronobiforma cellulositropha TaxID=1679076 RepID=UPI0021D5974D|nr:cupin domain-containing protein [Natronobiforma cellulositropha]